MTVYPFYEKKTRNISKQIILNTCNFIGFLKQAYFILFILKLSLFSENILTKQTNKKKDNPLKNTHKKQRACV